MKVGDRVRLSAHGKEIFALAGDADGTVVDSVEGMYYDWIVQWHSVHEDDYAAHHEDELEVIS